MKPDVEWLACEACGKQLVPEMRSCPHCGHQFRRTATLSHHVTRTIILLFIIVVPIMFLLGVLRHGPYDGPLLRFLDNIAGIVFGVAAVGIWLLWAKFILTLLREGRRLNGRRWGR